MNRLATLIIAILTFFTAAAQVEHSIILDQSSFRKVNTDALTGVNVDPIRKDSSRNACARVKIQFANMSRAEVDALVLQFRSNTDIARQEIGYYDNILILEMTAKPNTRFYVQSPEYGQSNEVTLNLEGDTEYEMEARLNQSFSIIVDTNAAGADIYIDGIKKAKTDANYRATIKEVMVGEHTLKLAYNGISAEQKIVVNGDNISFRISLNTAVLKPQYVVFNVEPKNTVVTIDGQLYTAEDGVVVAYLEGGNHTFKAEARGYHPQSGTFTVEGAKIERTITLKGDYANVTIKADSGADIYVNDKKMGTTTWSGRLNSGLYLFEARKAGYHTQSLTQQITSDNPQQSYTLPALTPIYGSADITSSPAMADITIDGKFVGRTPLQLDNLLVGTHTVKISKSGYADNTQTITISEGKTTTVNATLTKGASNANIGGFEMVYVKGGTFTMGATAEQGSDAFSNEKPTHSVTVSDFYIGKYEITQAQWIAVMGSNPSNFQGDNLPVEKVSWNDIQEFIQKLNAQTGKKFRLPTEAEWEYAARGGSQSKGYKYSGSNNISDVAWYEDNSNSKTHPVGQKTPNELGIYDMSGNVYEWCQDWYNSSAYSSSSQTNPTGPSSGSYRVLRGGSWFNGAGNCRVSNRGGYTPDYRSNSYGFRLACLSESVAGSSITPSAPKTADTKTYNIGDLVTVNGVQGIVFQTSPVVKIVSVEENMVKWSTEYHTTKANNQNDGRANMSKIKSISGWETKYPAFKWCADIGDGWYLPAFDEVKTIFVHKDKINSALPAGKIIISNSLWSSTESSIAQAYYTLAKGIYNQQSKKLTCALRAVYVLNGGATTSNKVYKVGDYYNENGKEGVVFEVSADGHHGKIVDLKLSDARCWACTNTKILIGADSKTDGKYNMTKVASIANWSDNYHAFEWCKSRGTGWYMPSIEELKVLLLNANVRNAVNATLAAKGGKKIESHHCYWSSTESNQSGLIGTWYVDMTNGKANSSSKDMFYFVRAVATF